MLNLLLVKLEPIYYRGSDLVGLAEDNYYDVLVFEEREPFSICREYYKGGEAFNAKVDEINKSLGIEYGGQVVAVDRYPKERDPNGAEKTDWSGIERYITEFSVDVSSYDLILLLCPDYVRIVLAELNFAYKGCAYIIATSGLLVFENKAVLSVKTFGGEFRGIALQTYNELALDPKTPNEYYALRFEKKLIPDGVLNELF